MSQVSIASEYETCIDKGTNLGLKVGVLGTNFVVQNQSNTIVYLNSAIEAVSGFLDGIQYSQRS